MALVPPPLSDSSLCAVLHFEEKERNGTWEGMAKAAGGSGRRKIVSKVDLL